MSKLRLSKDERDALCTKLIDYVAEELDSDIGNLQAHLMLDFVADMLHEKSYKMDVEDSIRELRKNIESIEENMESLTYF